MSDLLGNSEVRFSRDEAQMKRNRIYVDFFVCYSVSERSLPVTTPDHDLGAKAI